MKEKGSHNKSREILGKIPEKNPAESSSPGQNNLGLFRQKKKGTEKQPLKLFPGKVEPVTQPVPGSQADSGGIDPGRPIGKGNPPRNKQFRKGHISSRKDYPKGKPQAKTVVAFWLAQSEILQKDIGDLAAAGVKLSQLDIMVLSMIKQAREGNVSAYNALIDRIEGKPVQSTKLLNNMDKQLEITIGFKRAPEPATKPIKKKGEKK